MELYEQLQRRGKEHEREALALIESCLEEYGVEGVALSFNGGKDCTVVLYLVYAAMAHRGLAPQQLVTVFFEPKTREFDALAAFRENVTAALGFHVASIQGGYKQGMATVLAQNPRVKAVLMGQRLTDPHGGSLQPVCPSSSGWPSFLRVNPILNWTYAQVWAFLRDYQLRYCSLYDEGYTSIGHVGNTHRNEALRRQDGSYAPAYCLDPSSDERHGRLGQK